MAIQIVNRYKQLLVSVPKGSFYDSDGQVLPHRDTPYELRITTSVPNREYGVFVNDKFRGLVTTNGSGVALVTVLLDKGRNDVKLVDSVTQQANLTYLTTRDYATLMAAQADVVEDIDEGIEQVMLDSRLATSSVSLIEDVFGKTVQTGNSFGYDLDTYRELLQELRTSYRYFGATTEGISRVVRAFTQISPLIYPRAFGPEWILGSDMLYPDVDTAARSYYTTSTLSSINSGGAGVSVNDISPTVGIGTGTLKLYGTLSPKKFTWMPPSGGEGAQVDITSNGVYTLYGLDYFDPIVGVPGPYVITSGQNSSLAIEVDDKGIISIALTTGGAVTAATIASDINAALVADARYGASYSAVASAYDLYLSGSPMISLTTPNPTNGSVTIHTNASIDAAQTLFNLPDVRGGLSTGYLAGATTIVLSTTTDMTLWPTPTSDDPIDVIIGRSTFHPLGTPNPAASITATELVKVTAVNKGTKTLTLQSGLASNHSADELAYLAGTTPYKRSTVKSSRSIDVNVVNYTLLPASTTTDSVVVAGSGLPDGWVAQTNAGAAPTLNGFNKHTYFELDRDLPFDLSVDHRVSIPVPDEILKYKGFSATISVWGSVDDPSRPSTQTSLNQIGVSFNNQATYSMVAASTAGMAVNAEWRPQQYYRVITISPSTTKMWIRFNTTAGTNGKFTVHRVRLTVTTAHGGLFLGDGTIPRNESKIKHGAFMYVWGYNPITARESESLGIANITQEDPGHIDKIAPDMVWLDKFDVSEYNMDTTPKNVKGVFSESHLIAGTSTNLDLVLRTPSRFTHLKPSIISDVSQEVVFATTSPFTAPLTVDSNEDQTSAILFEDGIPVTNDNWVFNNANEIELLYTPLSTVKYELRYHALIRFESAAIDLGTTYADYLWFADYHAVLRPEIDPVIVSISTGIDFDGSGVATLPERSDQDQSVATLIEDTGLNKRIVPISQWSFVDAQRIRISLNGFNTSSLYEFTYNAMVNHPSTDAIATVELRSSVTLGGLSTAIYSAISHNTVVGNELRYHQMRITLDNVRDIRDAKIMSLLIKGLGLFGSGLTIPVLRP